MEVRHDRHLFLFTAAPHEDKDIGNVRLRKRNYVAALRTEATEVGPAQCVQALHVAVGGTGHVEIIPVGRVALLLRAQRAPRHGDCQLFARPTIQGAAGRAEILFVAGVVQWQARPERDHGQAKAHLLGARHDLHSPVVVVAAEVPHGVLGTARVGIVGVEHAAFLLVGQRETISIARLVEDESSEEVPIVGVDDPALHRGNAINE
mmetsp:Transcript_79258/g.169830  ORF Transcript_79258/g.169830 Transcript_79258/m.169830 type:complete len:206 (-) Transcript_79258:1272-1889(-)